MNLIKVVGKQKLKKILEKEDLKKIQFVVVSDILKRKHFPKKCHVQFFEFLVPPPNTINTYCTEGKKKFKEEYMMYLNHPSNLYMINLLMINAIDAELDIAFVIAIDEDDYKYLDYIVEKIEGLYGIEFLSSKKYLNGEKSKGGKDEQRLIESTSNLETMMGAKLKDSFIDPTKIFARTIHPDDAKELPKKIRKIVYEVHGINKE